MLKIKDNIDLKELEKFGFSYNDNYDEYTYGDYWFKCIYLSGEDRTLKFQDEWYDEDFHLIDVIFDLTKADLLEKI